MKRDFAETILAARAERRPVALLTWLASGEQRLVPPEAAAELPELADIIADAFRLDKSGTVETSGGEVFVRIFNPPLRMIIIGAVHAAQYLLPMARMAGHDVTIVDPRTAFATEERFPDANVIADWPEDAMAALGIDRRTAIIALTHDAKIDDPAIRLGLERGAFYVGALGSTRTHAKRVERLTAAGMSEADLARIHAPIGLDIGAQGPAEIALSIMAQVVQVLRGRKAAR